ncbi:MAG: ubiquinone/menaquinone biosynthesis C-methylase UbiE [Kiritimatiellia bacterium]|jgi:ubiquinone/menaquinone biosynthesis C-methylase UbiE
MSLKSFINQMLAPLRVELVRKEGSEEKPWDHTFKEGVKAAQESGADPNEAVRAAWGDPDWLRYYVPLVNEGDVVCEVGPGAGRWTAPILDRVSKLYLVDYSAYVCDLWRAKNDPRMEVIQCANARMPTIPDASVDFFMSLDVFVHLDLEDFYGYLQEAWRVLKPGGKAVIDYMSIQNDYTVQYFKDELIKADSYGGPETERLIFRFHDTATIQCLAKDLGFTFENEVDTWPTHAFCTLSKP